VRWHADRHSVFVMCVPLSQKPMQSASDLPPPPGALGADSLGLLEEDPGESARLLVPVDPPVENCVGSCGDSGAIADGWDAGDPIWDDGAVALGVEGDAGGPLDMIPLPGREVGKEERPPPERA
jgi:hypothetical protein